MRAIKPIKTKKEFNAAVSRLYYLMEKGVRPDTKLGDELEVLSILIEAYENTHYPIAPPHPLEAIKFRLEQSGLSEKELSKILGGRSRKSEILSGRRKLSLSMIRKLHKKLNISAESLIAEY